MSENRFEKYVQQPEAQNKNRFSKYLQEPQKQEEQGNFSRGFETAMRQVPQTIGGVIGLAGDAVGSDEVKDYGMNIYKNQSQKIQDISKDSDSFTNVLNGDASLGDWATYGTGYVGGQALQALATGGVGGLVGKKIAEKGIAKAVEHEAGNLAAQEAAKQAVNKGVKYGAGTALGASNFVQEAGSIYPEALEQAEKDGRTLDGGDLTRVAGAAAGAAALDTLVDASLLKGVLHGGSGASNIAKRAIRTVPAGMAKEGLTEGAQTGTERWGAQQDLSNDDAIRDYVDSAAMGALGGGLAGAGGAFQQKGKKELEQQQARAAQEEQRVASEAEASERQQLASQQQQLFGIGKDQPATYVDQSEIFDKTGIPPAAIIDESKLQQNPLSYDNGIDYQQPQINPDQTSGVSQNNGGIPYTPQQIHDSWSIEENPQSDYGNSIEYKPSKTGNLESQIQFNDTYGQGTPDPIINSTALSPFTETQQPILDQTKLSERLGINPSNGPMSSAAALAVDSGVTQSLSEKIDSESLPKNVAINESTPLRNTALENSTQKQVQKPIFSSNQKVGTLPYAQDISNQALQQFQGDTAALLQTNQSLTSKGPATDLIYFKNSPSFSNVEVEDAGDKSIVKLTNAKTGSVTEREYPAELVRFNQFLDEADQPDNGKAQAQNVSENVSNFEKANPLNSVVEQQPITTETANSVSTNVSDQISELEQQFASAKTVPQKAKLRKQIEQLKTQQQNEAATQWQNISQEQRHALVSQIDTVPAIKNRLPTANWEGIGPAVKDKLIQVLTQQSPQLVRQNIDTSTPIQSEISPTSHSFQKYDDVARQYGRSVSPNGVILSSDGKDTGVRIVEKKGRVHVESSNGQLLHTGADANSIGNFLEKFWGDKKSNNPSAQIDTSANEAATSPLNNTPEPTQAQIEAGNYKKGHVRIQGLDISIENPKGSTRSGNRPDGTQWEHTMSDHYGYIKRTKGADNEHIDTYIGNNPDSNQVFIVDQIDQESGNFDEHKVMLGFDSQEEATTAYKSNFDKGWKVGPIRTMDMEQFKDWLKNEDTTKPAGKMAKNNKAQPKSKNILGVDIGDKVTLPSTQDAYGQSKPSETYTVTGINGDDLSLTLDNGSRTVESAKYLKQRYKNLAIEKQNTKPTNDYSRDKLKPDNERRGASPLDTTFTPLSVVSATRRVLSILQHLKMSATQDASSRGRINVSLNNRIGVNKVGNVNSNGFSVQVISSFSDLPKVIQNDATYKDENGKTQNYDVSGVWHDGTLYVVADQVYGDSNKQLTTFDAYEELLTHEIVGHFGVQKLFGNEYKTKFQQLFNALGKLEGIRKIAKDNGVDMQQFESAYIEPYTQGVKDEIYTESDVQQALVSELFAFVAQNAKSRPFVRQKLKEVIGYIRQWFRDRGFDQFLSRYNDADLMMFLSEARKAVVDRSYFGKYKNQEFSSKNNSDTPLYSRRTKSNSGSTVQQVRSVLIDRFGKETIDELERQGKLEIIQDYQVEGVEGYYYNGKAVLVASNLTDQSVIPTFLHELGGHAGFQNMMNQKQYNELMNQFNKLVEQGNPVALAAKMLAEREQGSERQHLEYLPYLLTLSSTMQQRNVIQRNALQRLIQNIVTYVKAWVFDRFGVNLNLNPDDMLALSERMIEKFSYHSDAAINQHGVAKYSLNENSHAPFQKAIDRVMDGHTPQQFIKMGKTPDVLKMVGMPDAPITIHGRTIEKVMGEYLGIEQGNHSHLHNLTPETLRQLPQQINNPIAIFKSADTASKNGYIVLTELRETDTKSGKAKPVVVALHVKASNTGIEIVNVASVYGRSTAQLQRALDNDLLYWNKEKGQLFLKTVGLQLPLELQSDADLSNANIKTNEDLVKYQEQPLYSRSSNYDDITNRIANGFKNLPKTGDWINKKGVDWLKFGLQALSRRHLTEIYGKLLPPLNKYNELAAQMDADKNDIAAEADNIVREWSKLKDEEALANVMHDATLAQIDPAKPYQQGDNKVKYQQLLHAYNNLSPEAQAMYKKARNAYSGHYAKVREAIRERILRSALSSQKKADLLQKIEGSFGQIKGVYFPLARFGKYVVVLRNQNGEAEVVSRAETYSEAKSIRSELMLKYPQFKADDVEQDAEFNASRDSVGRGFMSDLFDEVGNLGLDAKAQAEFEDTLSQLYLSSMPDLSWAKHGIHRKGTAGFSNDARRAFAQHMFSGANYLGKLRYGDQLAQQLDEMKKYSKEQFNKGVGYDQRSARSVIDEMEKRHELLMNPKGNPLSSFLTSVGFMYYMGLSPAAAIVNLSQTALVAYPIMGAKWGFDKAGKELLKASSDFAKGVEFNVPDFSSLENFKNSIGDVYSPNIDKVIKGLELDAYNKAVSRGVIDVTQAHDLAGIAQGEDSKVMWYFRPAMRLASGMFHHAERFNREVTFIAAYRLATQAGANHDTAFEQAMDAVYKGHFDYSAGNRARFMQGPVAKVLLLFKQYAQNMIYTLVRNAHQSIYALDPKEQKEARRALAGILGMHALAAGAIGLPITGMLATASILIAKKSKLGAAAFGAAALAAFFGAADGDDEDPYELENVIRNWLADIHPTFADLVFGGVPRAFSPVDLSGRVGLNNLIIPDVQEGLEGADWATAMQSALLGPVVGISTSTVKGLQQIQEGDYWRGIETMLPIFLKNIRKSFRYADEGVLTKNKDVIHPEDVTGVELFSQAIGFSPASVRTSYEGRSAIFQYRTKLEDHRRELMRKWVVARQEDDSDGMNKVWTEILEFNAKTAEKNPKMRISRMNLMQSYKATERKAKETGDGGVYLTKRQKGAEEQGGFAFNR